MSLRASPRPQSPVPRAKSPRRSLNPSRSRSPSLTPVFPSERLAAPEALADVPFGKGSRVAIGGPPGAGASKLLREIAAVLGEKHPEVELAVTLAGVRPEEVGEWRANEAMRVY